MANVTITTAANFIPEVWATLILDTAHKNVVLANLVDRRFEKFARVGDTVHVPGLAEISATTTTNQPASVTFSANTESVTNIALNQHVHAAVKVDDQVILQSLIPTIEYYTEEIGRAIAEAIDTAIAGDNSEGIDSFTQVEGTDNVDVTDDNVLRCIQYLDDANAPGDGRAMVVSPATLMSLRKIEKYVNSLYSAGAGALAGRKTRGYIGPVYDLDVYETTNLEAGSSGKKNGVFQKEAISLTMQQDVEVTFREPHDEFATAVRAQALYGLKKLRNTFGVELDGK